MTKVYNQQNRLLVGCVYAEVSQHSQCFAYDKCFSKDNFHPYVKFQASDTFPRNQNFKINLLTCKGLYITLAFILKPFYKIQEGDLTTLIAFSCRAQISKIFFLSPPTLLKLYVKCPKRIIKYRYILIAITLCLIKLFTVEFDMI